MRSTSSDSDPPIRKRCKRFNIPGHAHFLTFSCFQRRPFLTRDRSRTWAINAIQLACDEHELDLWAYVIMPEHAHWLFLPRPAAYDVSAILTTFKQSVSKRAVCFVRRHAPEFMKYMIDRQPNGKQSLRFWQRGGGYDENLWSPRVIWDKIDYIHMNPVRRGVRARPEDWLWSSATDYLGIRRGPLAIAWASLPPDPRYGLGRER